MEYYDNAYSKFYNQNSVDMQQDDWEKAMAEKKQAESMQPTAGSTAMAGGQNLASTGGNVPLAAGLTALDFVQKQQAAKIAQKEAMKKARMASIGGSTDMLNAALDRYMMAVK